MLCKICTGPVRRGWLTCVRRPSEFRSNHRRKFILCSSRATDTLLTTVQLHPTVPPTVPIDQEGVVASVRPAKRDKVCPSPVDEQNKNSVQSCLSYFITSNSTNSWLTLLDCKLNPLCWKWASVLPEEATILDSSTPATKKNIIHTQPQTKLPKGFLTCFFHRQQEQCMHLVQQNKTSS